MKIIKFTTFVLEESQPNKRAASSNNIKLGGNSIHRVRLLLDALWFYDYFVSVVCAAFIPHVFYCYICAAQ